MLSQYLDEKHISGWDKVLVMGDFSAACGILTRHRAGRVDRIINNDCEVDTHTNGDKSWKEEITDEDCCYAI